jgi:hypothetical protein
MPFQKKLVGKDLDKFEKQDLLSVFVIPKSMRPYSLLRIVPLK